MPYCLKRGRGEGAGLACSVHARNKLRFGSAHEQLYPSFTAIPQSAARYVPTCRDTGRSEDILRRLLLRLSHERVSEIAASLWISPRRGVLFTFLPELIVPTPDGFTKTVRGRCVSHDRISSGYWEN